MVCSDKKNKEVLVGIDSWTRLKQNKIGKEKYPGVFTHILEYKDWINGVIKNSEKEPKTRSDTMKVSVTCFVLIFMIVLDFTFVTNTLF